MPLSCNSISRSRSAVLTEVAAVSRAIKFNRKICFHTEKVYHAPSERVLTPKFQPRQSTIS